MQKWSNLRISNYIQFPSFYWFFLSFIIGQIRMFRRIGGSGEGSWSHPGALRLPARQCAQQSDPMFCWNGTIPENCVVCQKGEFIFWIYSDIPMYILGKNELQSLNLYIGKIELCNLWTYSILEKKSLQSWNLVSYQTFL